MAPKAILGVALLVIGCAFGAGCFLVLHTLGVVEAACTMGPIALGAWLLDSPDVGAFAERARTFLPGAKP